VTPGKILSKTSQFPQMGGGGGGGGGVGGGGGGGGGGEKNHFDRGGRRQREPGEEKQFAGRGAVLKATEQ